MSRVGVSTACFYPESVFEALKKVADAHTPVTEVFMNSFSEMTPQKLRELSEAAKNGGTEIISFHPFLSAAEHMFFFSGYEPRVNDGIEIYKRFFEAAAILGAKYFIFHGEKMQTRDDALSQLPEEKLLNVYGRLVSEAKAAGIMFTQENVTMFRSENTGLISVLKNEFPDIGFALDIKQVLRAGKEIDDMIDAMSGRIVQVHLNNYSNGVCTLPLDGSADAVRIYEKLCSLGYKGDYCIEVYRSNFSDADELFCEREKVSKLFK